MGCAVTELPPLSQYTDVDALNSLFGPESPTAPRMSNSTLEFEYDGVVVAVSTVGTIEVVDGDGTVSTRD